MTVNEHPDPGARMPVARGLRAGLAALLLAALAACASLPAHDDPPWAVRLGGDAIVLFGEVHDNAAQHRLRLEILRRAIERGWRPAIAMEQFDLGR